jgi:hypothetical protein
VSAQPAISPASSPRADALRLRLAFEAASARRAAAVAEQVERLSGQRATIHPLEPLPRATDGSNPPHTFSVEVTTAPLPFSVAAIHMWERKMLSLEYRLPECRFLGWTTQGLPELSARRSRAVAEDTSAGGRARSQRELVEDSVLRRPRASLPPPVPGRREIRAVR